MTEPAPRRWLLLGRAGCHLCDEMHEAVTMHLGAAIRIETADVDTRPEWQRRYGLRVPVLLDEWGEVIAEGRFEP